MNFLDVIILCVLFFFAIRGMLHGFVAEILGLVALFGGLFLANNFYTSLAIYMDFIASPMWRNLTAYIAIFVAVNIGVMILQRILQKVLHFSFVGWIDSAGGIIVGFVKGLLMCTIMLILFDTFSPGNEAIGQSYIVPYLDVLLVYASDYIPADIFSEN